MKKQEALEALCAEMGFESGENGKWCIGEVNHFRVFIEIRRARFSNYFLIRIGIGAIRNRDGFYDAITRIPEISRSRIVDR